ncbi:MAG TPA: hypothetical protein VFK68_04515 [Propionibacteriaceae bacterium]|nr:hypothetical protein [Propionibacteriaceae bacterium]
MSTDSVGPQPTDDDLQPEPTDPVLYPTGDPEPGDAANRGTEDEPDEAAVEDARVRLDEVKTEAVVNHYRV